MAKIRSALYSTNARKVALGTVGGLVAGAALGLGIARASSSKKSKKRKTRSGKSTRKRTTIRRRKTPRTAGKRKDRSRKRIRYTKNGQPYVILASGKARFISIKSAKSSRKRRGGRY